MMLTSNQNPETLPLDGPPDAPPPSTSAGSEAAPLPPSDANALRFEDLTIDDDLTLLDRVVRYVRSGIALQRLVHVKMLAETGRSVGTAVTVNTLIPLLAPLVSDVESIIRQHLASQLLPLALTCMFGEDSDRHDPQNIPLLRKYNEQGYKTVTTTLLIHLSTLVADSDIDVRKASSDALATLALYIRPEDVSPLILPVATRLARNNTSASATKDAKNEGLSEDLRITAANLLGDISSLSPSPQIPPLLISQFVTPTALLLCRDPSFRVRRAAVQALPRLLSGSSLDEAQSKILPAFIILSQDDMYRVRKSVGECLVDMSRSLMSLSRYRNDVSGRRRPSSNDANDEVVEENRKSVEATRRNLKERMMDIRRKALVPVATRLLGDSNKFVRHGMMQFLGPFIASFYPLDGGGGGGDGFEVNAGGIVQMLSGDESDILVGGMGPQFFPHVHGMVSRLNPTSVATVTATMGPVPSPQPPAPDSDEFLRSRLPQFLESAHNDAWTLNQILAHRQNNPPSFHDVQLVKSTIIPPYVALATISTGDENIDAEMRVYCAYSLPAVVLLLGKEGWEGLIKECFLSLITGRSCGKIGETQDSAPAVVVPQPVKRCLASSFHTICHILGSDVVVGTMQDREKGKDMVSLFQIFFLRDSDDTVRLNIIRNLPSFLGLLPPPARVEFLPIMHEIISGDVMLGALKRRSATNPTMLNWRQRDMVAQILPKLITLYRPAQVRQYLWPIVQILMSDTVSIVREDVEWCIPIMFRCYSTHNYTRADEEDFFSAGGGGRTEHDAADLSAESCREVLAYLRTALLENSTNMTTKSKINCGAFSKRQGYCRICAAVGLSLRLGRLDKRKNGSKKNDKEDPSQLRHPFFSLTSEEYRHVHHILKNYLLPTAIEMKDDRVTNVRLTLAKCLTVMPLDIRDNGEVSIVLRTLEDEAHTWEGGGGMYLDGSNDDPQVFSNEADVGQPVLSPPGDSADDGNDTMAQENLTGETDPNLPTITRYPSDESIDSNKSSSSRRNSSSDSVSSQQSKGSVSSSSRSKSSVQGRASPFSSSLDDSNNDKSKVVIIKHNVVKKGSVERKPTTDLDPLIEMIGTATKFDVAGITQTNFNSG